MRLTVVLICWLVVPAMAQTKERNALDSLVQVSQRYYNARQPDSLYRCLTKAFQQQVSATDWRTFLATTYARAGRWQGNEYSGKRDGFTTYKSAFERETLLFKLAVAPDGQIAGFGLSPYVAPTKLAGSNPLRTLLDRQLDSVVQVFASQNTTVGLSIGVLRNDSLFVYGYGETAVGNGRLPGGNTQFEIGSISKTFTATLLADAIRRGLLRLDDPVNQHLPDSIPLLQKDGVTVTIRMLANHTSGLPRLPGNMMVPNFSMQNPYRTYDRTALFSFLKTIPLADKPGTVYQYSNLAVGLLGTILEMKTKQPYGQQLQAVITGPLGMKRTSIGVSEDDKAGVAQGHTPERQPTPNWDFQALAGAGAIRSTANDLLLYVQAELGRGPKRLVELMRTTQQTTFKNDQRSVGLAWHQNAVGKDVWVMHNGGTGGFVSFAGFNPQNKTAIVVLSNAAVRIDETAFALIKACKL